MPAFVDLTGKVFGRWKVSYRKGISMSNRITWWCVCSCGTEREVVGANLVRGLSKSCGCLNLELCVQRATTHGMSDSSEFRIWQLMIDRCHNPKSTSFHNYGERGIEVCSRWRESFSAFYEDMGPRPEDFSVERKDNNGGYTPSNCVWIPKGEQAKNKRTNRRLVAFGRTQLLVEWARELGVSASLLHYHLKNQSLESYMTTRKAA